MRNANRFLVREPEEITGKNLEVGGRIILKWMLQI
jgi:hypothetical protein